HLYHMDHLRHAIGLEGYAQKDPRLRYKEEGYRIFQAMNQMITAETARLFFRVQIQVQPAVSEDSGPAAQLHMGGFTPRSESSGARPALPAAETAAFAAAAGATGDGQRSDPNRECPCGSGLPFKRCHGK